MKLPIVPLLSSILILLFSCNSKCSLSNFDIVGKWDVDKFDIFGGQDKVKNFCDPQDIDYDEYSCETKMLFEQITFNFRDDGTLVSTLPEELGGYDKTTYSYSSGSKKLTYAGIEYELEVVDCDSIIMIEHDDSGNILVKLYCSRSNSQKA